MSDARPDDLGKRIFYRVARALVLTPLKVLLQVSVRGGDKLPRSGAYVVAPSHRSIMDVILTPFITRRRVRFMAKQELFEKPFLAWLFTALGGFPVDRGVADRSAIRAAEHVLQGGEPLAVFPEGTRHNGPEIGPLFDGAVYLAAKLGVPIVPVGVGGTEQILASGRVLPKLHKVAIVVGDPILPPVPPPATGEASGRRPRVRRHDVADTTAKLRVALQDCFDEAQSLAGVEPPAAAGPGSAGELGRPGDGELGQG
jgi:1-acyl-sn-glycerol-3-phosphate acyltransferase